MRNLILAGALGLAGVAPQAASAAESDWTFGVSASAQVQSNDNVFATASAAKSDTVTTFSPRMDVARKFDGGALSAYVKANFEKYADASSEDANDWGVGGAYKASTDNLGLTLGASHDRTTESRRVKNARRDSTKRTSYDQNGFYGDLDAKVLGGKLGLGISYTGFDYQNGISRKTGAPILQDDRDHHVWDETVSYKWDEAGAWSVKAAFKQVEYDLTKPAAPHNRDSKGMSLGLAYAQSYSKSLSVNAALSYSSRRFDEPGFNDVDDFEGSAAINWTVNDQTQISFTADRSFQETVAPNSPLYISTTVGASGSYQATPAVSLSAYVNYSWDGHLQIDRDDNVTSAGVSAAWQVAKAASVTLAYDFSREDSSGKQKSAGYDNGVVSLGLSAKF